MGSQGGKISTFKTLWIKWHLGASLLKTLRAGSISHLMCCGNENDPHLWKTALGRKLQKKQEQYFLALGRLDGVSSIRPGGVREI